MELRHLKYFIALAEELSFTRAAQRLHISQPPLSIQIAQLEEEIGVALLRRNSRNVELTPAGQVFFNDAKTILDRLSAAADRARAIGSGRSGRVDIGLSGSHFHGPLPDVISRYMGAHQDVAIVLHESRPATQLEDLRNGNIDLSISRTPVDDGTLVSHLLFHDPLVVCLPCGHRLDQHLPLSLRELAGEPFIMLRTDSSAYAQLIYNSCVQAGFAPAVVQWVLEVPAILSLVAARIGIGLIPRSMTHLGPGSVAVVPLTGDAPRSDVYVVQRVNECSAAVNEFSRMLVSSSLSSWQPPQT